MRIRARIPRVAVPILVLWLAAAALAACGGGSGSSPADPAPPGDAPLLEAPAADEGIQLTIDGFEVPAGGETEVCQRIYLPADGPLEIGGYEIKMPYGSHHFVLYAYEGKDAGLYPEGLFESSGCTNVGPSDSMNLVQVAGAGDDYEKIEYPAGTGIVLKPGQALLLNSHYANATFEAMRPKVYVNLYFAKQKVVHPLEAAAIGNYNIFVPPNATRTTTARWTVPFDMYLILASSHEHKRGLLYTARIVEGSVDRPEGDLVGSTYGDDSRPRGSTPEAPDFYRSEDWEHPTVLTYLEPRLFRQGTVVEFSCTHKNEKRVPVAFGPLSDDEMCFFTALYYRADGAPPAGTRLPGCLPQDAQLTCNATPISALETGPVVCGDGRKARAEGCDLGDENGSDGTCSEDCGLQIGDEPLGTREFPFVWAGPGAGASDFLNSITGGSSVDAAVGVHSDGALELTAGPAAADGSRPISQDATVTLGVGILAGNGAFCVRFYPTPNAGALHCDGGAKVGVATTLDNATGTALPTDVDVAFGVGADGGPGASLLLLNASLLQISGGPQECLTRDWSADVVNPIPFSTGNVIGTITSANGVAGTAVVMGRDGENFDCSRWTDSDGPGVLQAMPFLSPNSPGGVGDVIAQLTLAGHAPYGDPNPEPTPAPEPTPPPTEIGGELAAIADEVFVPRCALPSCHSDETRAGALTLTRELVYDELVDVPAFASGARSAGLLRVAPGDSGQSFLIRKLTGELENAQGSRMPLGNVPLDADTIDRIRAWIDSGAPPR
jgi:hypothetical protein